MTAKRAYKVWTAEDEAELRRLWAEGVKLSALAGQLGRARGSVSLKAARLGLPPRQVQDRSAVRPNRGGAAALSEARAVRPADAPPRPASPALPTRRPPRRAAPDWTPRTCQWLHGDARERNFCASEVGSPGSPWCPVHEARVFVRRAPPKERAEDANPA